MPGWRDEVAGVHRLADGGIEGGPLGTYKAMRSCAARGRPGALRVRAGVMVASASAGLTPWGDAIGQATSSPRTRQRWARQVTLGRAGATHRAPVAGSNSRPRRGGMHRFRAVAVVQVNRRLSYAIGGNHVAFTQAADQVAVAPLPEFYLPYACRLNRHLDLARENLMAWSRRMGIVGLAPGMPRCAAWSEQDLRAFDYALCSAGLVPDAAPPELDLASAWLCWASYGDDYYPSVFGLSRNLAGARAQNRRLLEFMPVAAAGSILGPAGALEAGLDDLWRRTTSSMTAGQRQQLRDAVVTMIDSWLWNSPTRRSTGYPTRWTIWRCAAAPSAAP